MFFLGGGCSHLCCRQGWDEPSTLAQGSAEATTWGLAYDSFTAAVKLPERRGGWQHVPRGPRRPVPPQYSSYLSQ